MYSAERELILATLQTFIRSRPGFDYANYGSAAAYRADSRVATKQLQHAERMIAEVRWRSISADDLKAAFGRAFGGRLAWDGKSLSYCAGQYYPMEFRAAACAVLASALWDYWASDLPPSSADRIRKTARTELGIQIAREWFR